MPDQSAADKTEQPTPERLQRARSQGQIPQSAEVSSALLILVLLVALTIWAPSLYGWFVLQVQQGLSWQTNGAMEHSPIGAVVHAKATESLWIIVPALLVGAAVSVLSGLLVGGWALTAEPLKPNLSHISPLRGLRSLLSFRSVVHLLVSMMKLTVILALVYQYLCDKLGACLQLRWNTPEQSLFAIARLVFGVSLRIVIALMAIALLDVVYQRWQYKRNLRMTRQEVKEERRQHEASPEVRGRVRAIHIEMVRRRMLQEVPEADVVVTNPTHVAVALKYEAATMEAPEVVAKGADLLAEKIKEIARAHGVPIVHKPPLARTLYATVKVGQPIPETLFVAVAEVLAMIYRLYNRRRNASGSVNRR
jgi:flagellar biosynthetic protein FlhB